MECRVDGPAEATPECYDIDVDVPLQPRDERIGGLLDGVNRDRDFNTVRPLPATSAMPPCIGFARPRALAGCA